jgi:hypothetical protein
LRLWLNVEKNPEEFQQFLDKYIYRTRDFSQYLVLCGGFERINQLRAIENLINLDGRG